MGSKSDRRRRSLARAKRKLQAEALSQTTPWTKTPIATQLRERAEARREHRAKERSERRAEIQSDPIAYILRVCNTMADVGQFHATFSDVKISPELREHLRDMGLGVEVDDETSYVWWSEHPPEVLR